MRLRIRPIKCPRCDARLPIKKKIFKGNYLTIVQCLACGTPCAVGGDKVDEKTLVRKAQMSSSAFAEDIWRGFLGEKLYEEAQKQQQEPGFDIEIMPPEEKDLK